MDRNALIRRQALRKLIADIPKGLEHVAFLCELTDERVRRFVEGQDALEAPMAMHMEEMLGLPSGWMERDDPIPQDVSERIASGEPREDNTVIESDPNPSHSTPATQSKQQEEVVMQHVTTHASPATATGTPDASGVEAHAKRRGPRGGGGSDKESTRDKMVPNVLRLRELFPAVYLHLGEHTSLSPASLSGILSGARNLTEKNARLFEQAIGLPHGWLNSVMPYEQAEHEFNKYAGELALLPKPQRGRPAEQGRPARAQAPAPARAPVLKTTSAAPRVLVPPPAPAAQVVQPARPAPAPEHQPMAATTPVTAPEYLEDTSRRTSGITLSQALIDTLRRLESKGELDDRKVVKILSMLFE